VCSDYDEFMEAICEKGERPPIPSNCLPSLKALLEDLWDADPDRRCAQAPIALAVTLAPAVSLHEPNMRGVFVNTDPTLTR
jgi:hypothetical protein